MAEEAELLAIASQRVGSVLHGKYHLDGVLGVGGMATVYAATHRNRKRFAVKLLHPEFSVRQDLRARFIREGYVANSVAHPGVVAVLDDDVDETGSAFLVMELLEGVTVDALYATSGSALPLREALGIAHQLLDVLDAAHQKAVVHRDIKPGNLFISREGELKVLDFGIARLREVDAPLSSTSTGATLGTPAFMSPEQARAMPEAIDARTDIWGAGATLFTMLTACFVHPGENARQIMIHAATAPARSIQSLLPELPGSVAGVVSRALEFERSQRWQSAAEMRDAVLEAYRALFAADPVRADIAALVARTSAALSTQPTEAQSPTPARKPAARELDVRPLQTTASTPVATRRPAPKTRARLTPLLLLLAVSMLGSLGVLALRRPAPHLPSRSASPAGHVAVEPVATETAAPASSAAVTVPSAPSALASAVPFKKVSVRLAPRPTPSAAPITSAIAVSRPSDNPLKLELQ